MRDERLRDCIGNTKQLNTMTDKKGTLTHVNYSSDRVLLYTRAIYRLSEGSV